MQEEREMKVILQLISEKAAQKPDAQENWAFRV